MSWREDAVSQHLTHRRASGNHSMVGESCAATKRWISPSSEHWLTVLLAHAGTARCVLYRGTSGTSSSYVHNSVTTRAGAGGRIGERTRSRTVCHLPRLGRNGLGQDSHHGFERIPLPARRGSSSSASRPRDAG